VHFSQKKLNELWDWANNNPVGLDGLERAPRVITNDEFEKRLSVPVEGGEDVVHYTRRNESDLWEEAD